MSEEAWRAYSARKRQAKSEGLTARAFHCLENELGAGFTPSQVAAFTRDDLLKIHNMGRQSTYRVAIWLQRHGLALRGGWSDGQEYPNE